MKKLSSRINDLCSPAYVYLVISVIGIIYLIFQNAGNQRVYDVGCYNCEVNDTSLVFLGKVLYIGLWTFILDALCKHGYSGLSWFLVLLPFFLFFIL